MEKQIKKIAVLTSGGDAPGMNATGNGKEYPTGNNR